MKNYRKALTASVLVLALSASASAGVMQTGKTDPPPPPTANGVMQTGATEEEAQTGEATSTPEAADTVAEIALSLLQNILTLF
jgi:hypothetical protein